MGSSKFRLVITSNNTKMILYYDTELEAKITMQLVSKGLHVLHRIEMESFDGDNWKWVEICGMESSIVEQEK